MFKLNNPYILAPMAGVNCAGFRVLCKDMGAGLTYTQMYHEKFIDWKLENEGKKAVYDFVNIVSGEKPVIQLVGHDPELLASAGALLEKKAFAIDLNLGCSVHDVVKNKDGAYLLKDLKLVKKILVGMCDNIKNVSAKIRIGFDNQHINCVKLAKIVEDAGCCAIAVHGRTADQGYSGKANWTAIKQIKDKVKIPVIGNGDVRDLSSAKAIVSDTKCDYVMIGRKAMGNPNIFRIVNCLDVIDQKEMFLKFYDYYMKYSLKPSVSELKTHAVWFAKYHKKVDKMKLSQAKSIEEVKELFSLS